jgi:hypothetical protein
MRCFDDRNDPGPCVVDDTPHTGCVSPDYDPLRYPAGGSITVRVERPQVLERTPVTFTTGTYRRAVHGPRRRPAKDQKPPKSPKDHA